MKPILLLGDSCIDRFVYCNCSRLCPESPVPVLDIIRTNDSKGMAGNVHRNMLSFTSNVIFIRNVNECDITKTRYVESKTNHMFIRIDNDVGPNSTFRDISHTVNYDDFSAIIMSDYDKGFLSQEDIQHISKSHNTTFLDTKKILGDWALDASFIKINRDEYDRSEAFISPELNRNIITTMGDEGARYRDKQYTVKRVEIKDLSGAGDTFLASLVYKYVCTGNIDTSLKYANDCSSVVVQRRGVSAISPDEEITRQ